MAHATPKPLVSQLAKTLSIREETLVDARMRVLLVWNRHHNLPDRLGCPLSPRDRGCLRVSFLLPCNQAEGGLLGNVAPRSGSASPDLSRRNPRSSRWECRHSSSRCFQVGRSPRGERYRSLWGGCRFRCSGLRLP